MTALSYLEGTIAVIKPSEVQMQKKSIITKKGNFVNSSLELGIGTYNTILVYNDPIENDPCFVEN